MRRRKPNPFVYEYVPSVCLLITAPREQLEELAQLKVQIEALIHRKWDFEFRSQTQRDENQREV